MVAELPAYLFCSAPMSSSKCLHGEPKRKRCLYLTDTAHGYLTEKAHCRGLSPSEVCEQLIRESVSGDSSLSNHQQTHA